MRDFEDVAASKPGIDERAPGDVSVASQDCVKVLDDQGLIVSFNDNGLRALGIDDAKTVMGRYWPDIYPPAVRTISERALQSAQAFGVAHFTAQCPSRSGECKWWDVTIAAVSGLGSGAIDAPRRYCVISRDITSQIERQRQQDASEERLEVALRGSGVVGLWDWMVDTDLLHGDANFARLYGLDEAKTEAGLTMEEYQTFVVEEDIGALRAKIRDVFERGADFRVEYRLQAPGKPLRWVECKGRMMEGEPDGRRRFSGTAIDITDRKTHERQRELLVNELNHRVKNTLAVVQNMARQTFKASPEAPREAFEGRLLALAAAHDVLTDHNWQAAYVDELVAKVLEPFRDRAEDLVRIHSSGPKLALQSQQAVALTLALHELCTNAVKYGALSDTRGHVCVQWRVEHVDSQAWMALCWEEKDGPAVQAPTRQGFGGRLLRRAVEQDLGGALDLRFLSSGVVCAIRAPLHGLVGQGSADPQTLLSV